MSWVAAGLKIEVDLSQMPSNAMRSFDLETLW
jgi:hypothetical protein